MNLLQRVIKADIQRPTRFHDLRGHPLDPASWLNIPVAVFDTSLDVAFHYRRAVPWISYRAARTLRHLIRPKWRILEFGSGLSTIWLASRSSFVLSIESDPGWYRRVARLLDKKGLSNVQLEQRPANCVDYVAIGDVVDHTFDLALIDGDCRDRCVEPSLRFVRADGYIYLDNTDQPGDRQVAEKKLLGSGYEWVRYYNDFAPGLVAITQGMLVKLAGSP
jgi:predicted O-methyltransferase YrrM